LSAEPDKGWEKSHKSEHKTCIITRTFSIVEEWQTIANFPKLSHPTIQSTQVLGVNLREISEG
jgi:hypothetical protein